MSQDDLPNDRTVPTGAPSDSARREPVLLTPGARPARSGGGTLALALLLALLAIVGVGYIGWRQWQQMTSDRNLDRTTTDLQTRVDTLERSLTMVTGQGTALRQQVNDADQVNRSMRDELLAQDQRLRDVEAAVGKLSEKTLSGQDAMRLDETESLLRMAAERYSLFQDAQGAAQAYALAEQALSAVDDNTFSGVQQSIDAERQALLKSAPSDRAQMLASIVQLRDQLASLPLKQLDTPTANTDNGFWARVGRALSQVISIRRDNGAPLAVADSRITRELVALDLAQAQAALLSWDDDACTDALKRADAGLAAQFDVQATSVQQARQEIAALSAQIKPAVPVKLGAALAELRNLRAVHALKSTGDSNSAASSAPATAPAPATSRSKP